MPVLAMLVLLSSAALIEAFRLSSLSTLASADVWWHLSTGLWIIQNHALPRNALSSQSSDFPWIASSWAYDLLLAFGYRLLDLCSIPALLMCFKAALALITFLLAGGTRGNFWPAVALSVIAQYILLGVEPGPIYCSMLLFGVELLLLTKSRATGSVRSLYWLPPLFLLWTNLDVRFAYGVALLLLFVATSFLAKSGPSTAPVKALGVVTALCLVATVMTPYFYHPWGVFFATATSAANRYLPEFHAMNFHQPEDYVLLLLTMAAFLSLGRCRSRDPFQILFLIGCAMLSFHAQRDTWVVTLAAVAVIGQAVHGASDIAEANPQGVPHRQVVTATVLTIAVILVAVELRIPRSRQAVLAKIAASYPVAACNFIREHHLPQPLFNAYEWGGFLTWYLPEYPVAIDSRADLYGDDFMIQYSKVMNAELPYTEYPALSRARTILLPRGSLMGKALSSVPAFKVAYGDDVAVVLIGSGPNG